ncbi:hypothetical protein GCM10023189_09030 [Nibrella saemangeumensis]|uniref:Response regulatory domain-containing protein n=2 Tax=Nibrella saemangeumensis TaxID=1084526 RepID=A0ABP8MHQ4_9BACT
MAQGLSNWIRKDFEEYELLFVAESRQDLLDHLDQNQIPEILLLDDYRQEVGGLEIIQILNAQYSAIRILVYTINTTEELIDKMIRAGARGYLDKGCSQLELKQAIDTIRTKGFYYSDFLPNR